MGAYLNFFFFPLNSKIQVRGLEFNAIAPNLLASGADEGEICIWDLAAPAEPSHFPPLKVHSPPLMHNLFENYIFLLRCFLGNSPLSIHTNL